MKEELIDLGLFIKITNTEADNVTKYETLSQETALEMAQDTVSEFTEEKLNYVQMILLNGKIIPKLITIHFLFFMFTTFSLIFSRLQIKQYIIPNVILLLAVFLVCRKIKEKEAEVYTEATLNLRKYLEKEENKKELFMVHVKSETKNPFGMISEMEKNNISLPEKVEDDEDKITFLLDMTERNQLRYDEEGFSILCLRKGVEK